MDNPLKYFSELTDPRVERNREHLLEGILLIAIAAVLSGAESWNEIAQYGEDKLEWLETFLTLPGGIPSHDTFNRVFASLDPGEMEKGFVAWVSSIAKLTADAVVAIDGKTLCGTRTSGKNKKTLVHMISAWAETNGLVLSQRTVDDKSNEIMAIPKLLDALELAGTVVTIDAMGCQREIARQIVEKKADYVLSVKENHPSLLADIQDSFQMLAADAVHEEIDCGHRRVERRTCSVLADLTLLENPFEWASLKGLVRIGSERYHKVSGKTEREICYYVTSLKPDARRLNAVIRQQWSIENKLHWVLDVDFDEDLCRKRAGHAAERTSPSSNASQSTSSTRTNLPNEASRQNDSMQLGTARTRSNYSGFDMRRPWLLVLPIPALAADRGALIPIFGRLRCLLPCRRCRALLPSFALPCLRRRLSPLLPSARS